jgi:hypothetical protein
MTPQDYNARRAKLVTEFNFLKSKRLYRSAAARVRLIAQLDLEYDNIPIEKTKAIFNYNSLI